MAPHIALLTSTGVLVATSEVGDKMQLLALLLASHCRKPLPTMLRNFVATVLNHRGGTILLDPCLRGTVQRQHAFRGDA
jgi:putative Ca2+/H+ antiporter (TMEM165/GDT1 family)